MTEKTKLIKAVKERVRLMELEIKELKVENDALRKANRNLVKTAREILPPTK